MSFDPAKLWQEVAPWLDRPGRESPDGRIWSFCPAHADGKGGESKPQGGRSLSLHRRYGLDCMTGCNFEQILEAFRGRGMGSTPAPITTNKPGGMPPGATQTAVYEYCDPKTGKPLMYKARYEWPDSESPKGYRKDHKWRLPESDKWVGVGGAFQPLYGAHRLNPSQPEQRIWWVEGEGKVDALVARNELAVSAPNGTGSRITPELLAPLRGRRVVIWPDNDAPGLTFAGKVRLALTPVCASVSTWIPDNMPEKGDAVDFFAAGRLLVGEGGEYVERISGPLGPYITQPDGAIVAERSMEFGPFVLEARGVRKEKTGVHATVGLTAAGLDLSWSHFNVERDEDRTRLARSAHGQMTEPQQSTMPLGEVKRTLDRFCHGLYPAKLGELEFKLVEGDDTWEGPTLILGTYVIEGGGTMLFGKPGGGKSTSAMLMGVSIDAGVSALWHVPRALRVGYVNLERDEALMRGRLMAANRVLGLPPRRPLLMINEKSKPIVDMADALRVKVRSEGIDLVIYDSVTRAGAGDLNTNESANMIIDVFNSISRTWIGIGHVNRQDETHMFGSMMFDAGMDIGVSVTSEDSGGAGMLNVGLKITKANDVARGGTEMWQYLFEKPSGLVGVRRISEQNLDIQVRQATSMENKVGLVLGKNGWMSAREVAQAIGHSNSETVYKVLSDGHRNGLYARDTSTKPIRWGLAGADDPFEAPAAYVWDGDPERCVECGATFAGVDGYAETFTPLCTYHLGIRRAQREGTG